MGKAIIAIDLGSNSIRFLKMDCETKETLGTFHKTVRTADVLALTGVIDDGAIARVISAIKEAKEAIDFSDATVKAVTTEAIRQATNGDEVLGYIKDHTGVMFEVIDGDEEASYALLATQKRLELLGKNPKSFMLADIGGASTELIFSYGDETISKSFQVGIVTITQSLGALDVIAQAMPALMNPLKLFCDEVYAKYGKAEMFVAIAGTPTTIAAMKLGMDYETYDSSKVQGMILSRNDLIEQLGILLKMTIKERQRVVGVAREDLIASGVLMYDELYGIGGFNESMVIDDGVREGVAFSMCDAMRKEQK
jgi:exopolyphosphatase/guanosine-5'-triphosphate,3'-diphosphate pyrophosphatase